MHTIKSAFLALVLTATTLVLTSPPARAADMFVVSVDHIGPGSSGPGKVRVYGWAFDPDAPKVSIGVHVYVGGGAGDPAAYGYPLTADQPRHDVAERHGSGVNVGFDVTFDVPGKYGDQPVYLYAINVPGTAGGNELIGAGTVHIEEPPPPPTPTPVPTPTPTSTPLPTPPGPPAAPAVSLKVRAVKKRSRLKVDVGPDMTQSNYRFKVQQRKRGKWRTVSQTQTLGARDVVVLNFKRGTYRVVVPDQHALKGAQATARLKR